MLLPLTIVIEPRPPTAPISDPSQPNAGLIGVRPEVG